MRSVVVVLPASMCALMPMLRYRSMGVVRGTLSSARKTPLPGQRWAARGFRPVLLLSRLSGLGWFSEAEVRERLVGFRHAVHFLALLHRAAAAFRGLEQLGCEALTHRLLAALARGFAQPAHRERHPADRTHLDRHLEIGAADATALHLDHRPRVRERLVEDLERILAALLRDRLERAVQDALRHRLLAGGHQHVDELGDIARAELRIGKNLALGYFSASGHEISIRQKVKTYFLPEGLPLT